MPTSAIGQLIAPWNVEQAALATVKAGIYTYLADVERQNGLDEGTLPRPPVDASYYGGVDFDSYEGVQAPAIIAVAKPFGEPEFRRAEGYAQMYEVEVGALVMGVDEQDTRRLAGLYAAAIMGAVIQHGSLGGISGRTRMVASPSVRPARPDVRTIAIGSVTFHAFVASIATEQGPPNLPNPVDAIPPDAPRVRETAVDYTTQPLT